MIILKIFSALALFLLVLVGCLTMIGANIESSLENREKSWIFFLKNLVVLIGSATVYVAGLIIIIF